MVWTNYLKKMQLLKIIGNLYDLYVLNLLNFTNEFVTVNFPYVFEPWEVAVGKEYFGKALGQVTRRQFIMENMQHGVTVMVSPYTRTL